MIALCYVIVSSYTCFTNGYWYWIVLGLNVNSSGYAKVCEQEFVILGIDYFLLLVFMLEKNENSKWRIQLNY